MSQAEKGNFALPKGYSARDDFALRRGRNPRAVSKIAGGYGGYREDRGYEWYAGI
jgi:hypothetical protein